MSAARVLNPTVAGAPANDSLINSLSSEDVAFSNGNAGTRAPRPHRPVAAAAPVTLLAPSESTSGPRIYFLAKSPAGARSVNERPDHLAVQEAEHFLRISTDLYSNLKSLGKSAETSNERLWSAPR